MKNYANAEWEIKMPNGIRQVVVVLFASSPKRFDVVACAQMTGNHCQDSRNFLLKAKHNLLFNLFTIISILILLVQSSS